MVEKDKKISSITWSDMVLEAMIALTGGRNDVTVPAEEMYRWIEATEYLTDKGRAVDPEWNSGRYPSYRASLQLRWQRMVTGGLLVRVGTGEYRLAAAQTQTSNQLWAEMLQVDAQISQPIVRNTTVRRIQRSQKLRDLLVNYYASHCQICGESTTHSIPLLLPNRYYVEVHHVAGLAESVYFQQQGQQIGLKVNGLENLTVLCVHHHAVMHLHYPAYLFDRAALEWRNERGGVLTLQKLTPEHAALLKNADLT